MIVSGQMTREEALAELNEPLYDEKMMASYIAHIKEALCITDDEFEEIMNAPTHQHDEFKVSKFLQIKKIIREALGRP